MQSTRVVEHTVHGGGAVCFGDTLQRQASLVRHPSSANQEHCAGAIACPWSRPS
jgi:hypothetical protein